VTTTSNYTLWLAGAVNMARILWNRSITNNIIVDCCSTEKTSQVNNEVYDNNISAKPLIFGFNFLFNQIRFLEQWFSTGVPRNARVPRASAKGSADGQ